MREFPSAAVVLVVALAGCARVAEDTSPQLASAGAPALERILADARRIPVSSGWFEVLRLPNAVYAFWEPGHADAVNAFLIVGSKRHVLYDTGLGFASMATAVREVMAAEQIAPVEVMVVNSHNHLDHNGGNREFPAVWIMDDAWGRMRLETGITGEARQAFRGYWDQFTAHPGVRRPEGLDLETFEIPPYPAAQINVLRDGDTVDLGNRSFVVIHTRSHSPDGLALYDPRDRLFFGGDVFLGERYLVRDLDLLAEDLERAGDLATDWHYSSHGPQLLQAMQQGSHLAVVRRMQQGEFTRGTTQFAGVELPLLSLDGIQVTLAADLLVY